MEKKEDYVLFTYLPNTSKKINGLRPIIKISAPNSNNTCNLLNAVNSIIDKINISLSLNIPTSDGDIEKKVVNVIPNNVDAWYYLKEINSFVSFSFKIIDTDTDEYKIPIGIMLILKKC